MGMLDWLSSKKENKYFITLGQKFTSREFGFTILRLAADFSGTTIRAAIIDYPAIKQINGGEFLSSYPYCAHLYLTAYFTCIYRKYISNLPNIESDDLSELDIGILDSIKTITRPDGSTITDSEITSLLKAIKSFQTPLDTDIRERINLDADVYKPWSNCTEKYIEILRVSYNEKNEDISNLFPSYSPALLVLGSMLNNAPRLIFSDLESALAVKFEKS